jgi:biopolymer transport protein ExbD
MKLKRRHIKRGRIEIIPMIDTIVILLIFHMSFSTFVESAQRTSIPLPVSRAGDDFQAMPEQVIVNMESADRIYIGTRILTVHQLESALLGAKAQNPQIDAVILRGNGAMTYADLSAFMIACSKAGIEDVSFATYDTGSNR